ncbi:MAG: hypothetical protein HYY37_05010 [Candidatus Aenigmarchaeota archaeon]|nr:hypothetical protein [Candidatus Aenigmarchaeota archaeon]
MPKALIEQLNTMRAFPKTDAADAIRAVEFELVHELSPFARANSREQTFAELHYAARRWEPFAWTEYRLYFPGPKLWVKPRPLLHALPDEDYRRMEELEPGYEFASFAIQRNGGVEMLVPLLYDTARATLKELGIAEVRGDACVPAHMKHRTTYRNSGEYETARRGRMHPSLGETTVRDSLLASYEAAGGRLPPGNLLAVLTDYSRIIGRNL